MDFGGLGVVVLADSPEANRRVCGVPMVERTLRNLQRLGCREITVLLRNGEAAEWVQPNWARPGLQLSPRFFAGEYCALAEIMVSNSERVLLVPGDYYYDAQLLRALACAVRPSRLIDVDPPPSWHPLLTEAPSGGTEFICGGAALITRDWLLTQPSAASVRSLIISAQDLVPLPVSGVDTYVSSMRRHIRPLWFPAPAAENIELAETLVLDAAQNGVLDAPALVHAPIETWLVRRLSRTAITPNQITLSTLLLGCAVTIAFLTGHLWLGAAGALIVGLLDGVDGKLARAKVETTEFGGWEHEFDYALETSWWIALAWHFHQTILPQTALFLFLLFFLSDLIDRLAKRSVKKRLHRNLDDVSDIDRAIRFIGGRRNIYIWIFTFALLLGAPATGFVLICVWGSLTAAAHLVRALQIMTRPANRLG